jgi:hypothetical protein
MNKLVTARPFNEPHLPERRRRKKSNSGQLPALIAGAGQGAAHRFRDFFSVNIRNRNTRAAYARAAAVFLRWCEGQGITALGRVQPVHVSAYIEQLQRQTRLRPSSSISPVSVCCSIGWSLARCCRRIPRTPSGGRAIR